MCEERLRLFGLGVATHFPFLTAFPRDGGVIDLRVERASFPRSLLPSRLPLYESRLASLYRVGAQEILHFPEVAEFLMGSDRIEVLAEEKGNLAELRFLGPVLSYWLERRGVVTLHASAVATVRGVVAFLSRKEGGKTGLAAAFLRAGIPLVTDDVLAIEETGRSFLARPGYPRMRMWPDEARWYSPDWEALPFVHPAVAKRWVPVESFVDGSRGLAALLIPYRTPCGPIEIEEISPRDALIELIRHSFSPRLVEAAGLQPRRLDLLSRLALTVPVRRLRYPSGFERLPEVVAALTSRNAW